MELRRYWQIILRYWPVVVVLTLVGALAAYQYYKSNPPTYQASAVINIYQEASPNDTYSGIYADQASEYAADDFIKIIQGNTFMKAVADQLKEIQVNLSPDELKGMVTVERKHRELTITTTNNDSTTALRVARSVSAVLKNDAPSYIKGRPVVATVLDSPAEASLTGGRSVLQAGIRLLAGLLSGLGLAFLLSYLDNSVRSKAEAEEILGLPVLGMLVRPERSIGTPGSLNGVSLAPQMTNEQPVATEETVSGRK